MIRIEHLQRQHRNFIKGFAMMLYEVAEASRRMQETDAKMLLRPHTRTGNLLQKTESKLVRTSRRYIVVLRNSALKGRVGYASFLDKGTSPHIIRARRARVLRFLHRGRYIFRKQVNHPGNRAFLPFTLAHRQAYGYAGVLLSTRMQALASKF